MLSDVILEMVEISFNNIPAKTIATGWPANRVSPLAKIRSGSIECCDSTLFLPSILLLVITLWTPSISYEY